MLIFLIALFCISVFRVKFSDFHENYMGREQTTSIKGILAVLILLSHMNGYVQLGGTLDSIYLKIMTLIGQLMVTLFFFYSGYGIMESARKNPKYPNTFFRKRFLKVLLHFDLALLLFVALNVILNIKYPAGQYLFCWIGWGSIGNSNWFVFDTLVFYLLSLAVMHICRRLHKGEVTIAILTTILCIVFYCVLAWAKGPEAWWYNTILCYPAGVWYSVYKKKIDALAQSGQKWWLCLGLVLAAFAGTYLLGIKVNALLYDLCTPIFCVLVVWLTMKVRIHNRVLHWLGEQSFSIYILQRLPMIVFTHFGIANNKFVFAVVSTVVVMLISAGFTWLLKRIDAKLFR